MTARHDPPEPSLPPIEIARRTLGPVRVADPRPLSERGRFVAWLIRIERWLAHRLSLDLLPRVPGLSRIYGFQLRRSLTLVEGTIELPGLAPAWDGCRLLLLSDLHAGPFLSPATLNAVCHRLSREPADVVVIAGDFVSGRLGELQELRPGIAHLVGTAPTFGVLGNHDHYTERPDRLVGELERDGVVMLQNRAHTLRRDGQSLQLVGIDDWRAGEPRLERVLEEVDEHGPRILISHSPDSFFDAAERGVDLVLSGHTHGGQIRIPGGGRLVRPSRYRLVEGHYFHRSQKTVCQLVISRGLGAVALPLRFRCPPEAALLTLQRALRDPLSRAERW